MSIRNCVFLSWLDFIEQWQGKKLEMLGVPSSHILAPDVRAVLDLVGRLYVLIIGFIVAL